MKMLTKIKGNGIGLGEESLRSRSRFDDLNMNWRRKMWGIKSLTTEQ